MINPIMVLGCGFSGSNAVVKILIDMGVHMGDVFADSSEKHPYPIYEDLEINLAFQNSDYLIPFFDKRANKYPRWGFKIPNIAFLAPIYLPLMDEPKIIACYRDENTLIKRMMERWDYQEFHAWFRIRAYDAIVNAMERFYPVLHINQEHLRTQPEDTRRRIKEFIE